MNQYGSSFAKIFNEFGWQVNKGALKSFNHSTVVNSYYTLNSSFTAYQVPASYQLVLVGCYGVIMCTSSTMVNFSIGYGDNSTTSAAPTNPVAAQFANIASTAGNIVQRSFELIIPAGKYPYVYSGANITTNLTVFGYLEGV